MKKLLPCPFCGGEAEILDVQTAMGMRMARCKKCWAKTVYEYLDSTVIEAWNTRYEEI